MAKVSGVFKQTYSKANRKIGRKARDAALDQLDKGKLTTKIKKGIAKGMDAGEDLIDEAVDFEALDRKAGKAVDYIADKAKKAGEKVGVTAGRAKRAGSWVKKHPAKTAAGVAAVGAGVAAATKDDKNSVKSQLARIKAKDPSERTASEKRLLRLMED